MNLLLQLRLAFGFLTRLPMGTFDAQEEDVASSLAFFPWVGLALGTGLGLCAWLLASSLPAHIVGLVLVALSAALTGGLHLDGVADVFDGLGGGRGQRDRTLEIMRDSRIGSHGAVALMLLLLGKTVASGHLIGAEDWAALVLAPLAARLILIPAMARIPYAREQGLGRSFQAVSGKGPFLLAGLALVPALLVGGSSVLWPLLGAALGSGVLVFVIYRRIQGLTGDGYGAIVELAELLFLIFSCTR